MWNRVCASARSTYPGFPGTARDLSDPELKVAFFALLYNQTPDTPMEIFARDVAGNERAAQFEHRMFPKKFRNSRIPLDDKFLVARRARNPAGVAAAEGIALTICCRRFSRSTTTSGG